MNILHLNEWTEIKGGVEVYISQLQGLLKERGHISHWIGINEYEGLFKISSSENEVIRMNNIDEVIHYLQGFIRSRYIDLINVHNLFNPSIVSFCLGELPVIKFSHGPVMVCPGKDKFWRYAEEPCTIKYGLHCFWHIYTQGCANRHPKRVLKAWSYVNYEVEEAAKKYSKIIVMSDYIKSGLLECGVDENKIICNPYFTTVVRSVTSGDPYIVKRLVFVGRLISSKGPHVLIEALTTLLKERKDVYLDIVGDGIMMEELLSIAKKNDVTDKISFHGWMGRDEVDLILKNAYIVYFPSVYPEAFGIAGIEAMMRGKPVIGFDVGGVSTWLENNITGYLVPNKDDVALREKTEILLNDRSVYEKMAANAREIALQKYTPENHMRRLLEVYQSALS